MYHSSRNWTIVCFIVAFPSWKTSSNSMVLLVSAGSVCPIRARFCVPETTDPIGIDGHGRVGGCGLVFGAVGFLHVGIFRLNIGRCICSVVLRC
ncbi:hypothetical protein EDB80DRAFT_735622 [Ilyonectria destructans]|nr:hypothetical protein EDB80DRAFT_735622 [Ilyonectria destructans]